MSIDSAWWKSLDSSWKNVFRKQLNFKGEATPALLTQIGSLTNLNAAQSEIKSLAPISGLKLTHLDFSGCKGLPDPTGIPKTIQTLTFHWMEFADIDWVDALPKLEKVYCEKALQTKINRRLGANKRKRKG